MNFRWSLMVCTWLSYKTTRNSQEKKKQKADAGKICLMFLLKMRWEIMFFEGNFTNNSYYARFGQHFSM